MWCLHPGPGHRNLRVCQNRTDDSSGCGPCGQTRDRRYRYSQLHYPKDRTPAISVNSGSGAQPFSTPFSRRAQGRNRPSAGGCRFYRKDRCGGHDRHVGHANWCRTGYTGAGGQFKSDGRIPGAGNNDRAIARNCRGGVGRIRF